MPEKKKGVQPSSHAYLPYELQEFSVDLRDYPEKNNKMSAFLSGRLEKELSKN